MENKRTRNQLFNLAYSSIILPYLGKADEGASIMLRLCRKSRNTWHQNLEWLLKIISEKACLKITDLLSSKCFDSLLNVPPLYFDFDVGIKSHDKCNKFYEFILNAFHLKKTGNTHYQKINFRHNLVVRGLSNRRYQSLIQLLVKEFKISYYQFRELNNDANEFVNLFQNSFLNDKKINHGLYYIRMVNLANYEYFINNSNSAFNQEAQLLNSICYTTPTILIPSSKRGANKKVKLSFKNKFYRIGYLSISESSVPHHFIKHAFKNLISYVNGIKISPYAFLERIEGISKSIQHHGQELEIISYSIQLPRGNYLRNVLKKFPHVSTFTLDTGHDILIEELLRILPVDDIHCYIGKDRDAAKFKAIFDKSQRLITLPESLSTFKFQSNHKDEDHSSNQDYDEVQLRSCEVDIVIRKGTFGEVYSVCAEDFLFKFTQKSMVFIRKQNEVLQDTLLINDHLNFTLTGGCSLVNYRARVAEHHYFGTYKKKPLFQIRIKTKDIQKISCCGVIQQPQLTTPIIDNLRNLQYFVPQKYANLSLKLSNHQFHRAEEKDRNSIRNNNGFLHISEFDFSGIEFSSIDISDGNLSLDEFKLVMRQISRQKRLESIHLSIDCLKQLSLFLEILSANVTVEYIYLKVNNSGINLNIKMGLRKYAIKRQWINTIQVNNQIVYGRAITNKIDY